MTEKSFVRAALIEKIQRECSQNIQFMQALRESKSAREHAADLCNRILDPEEINVIVSNIAITVLTAETKSLRGRYPQQLALKTSEEINSAVASVLDFKNNNKISLSETSFFCIGSCFATNLGHALKQRHDQVHVSVISENINSPTNNLSLFRFFLDGKKSGILLDEKFLSKKNLEDSREAFLNSNVTILTLGCAFTLIDSRSGHPLANWSTGAIFDEPTATGIAQVLQEISAIHQQLGGKRLFISVSPVPLAGTLKHHLNPWVSDAASKAILRSAVEEAQKSGTEFTYVPAFEVFRQLSLHSPIRFFGVDDGNIRHPSRKIVEIVVTRFIENNFFK